MAHGLSWEIPHGMWDLHRPGLEPVSPTLAGRFLTTVPPGKPHLLYYVTFTLSGVVFLFRDKRKVNLLN